MKDGFRKYLLDRKLDEKAVESVLHMIDVFDNFLETNNILLKNITRDEVHCFSGYLIEKVLNLYDNYVAILRYAYYVDNKAIVIGITELLDGAEMVDNFSDRLINEYGKELRNRIFDKLELPPLGLHPGKKPGIMILLLNRFIEQFGLDEATSFFEKGLRNKYPDWYTHAREEYAKAGSLDSYLKSKYTGLLADLERHKKNN